MGWGISVMVWPLFNPGKDQVPIVQEAGWAPGPVWMGAKNLAPTGIRSLDRPASQSLYRLCYPAHNGRIGFHKMWCNPLYWVLRSSQYWKIWDSVISRTYSKINSILHPYSCTKVHKIRPILDLGNKRSVDLKTVLLGIQNCWDVTTCYRMGDSRHF